jgi:hypothetical protein
MPYASTGMGLYAAKVLVQFHLVPLLIGLKVRNVHHIPDQAPFCIYVHRGFTAPVYPLIHQ